MAKLINKNIKLFTDDLEGIMSLYALGEGEYNGKKPIVFIRGHAGKWTVNTKKILDNAPCNYKLVKQHEGFWYDDNTHYPFIAEFSYKDNVEKGIKTFEKSYLTTQKFADSIIEMLNITNLKNVDVLGASVGANVAMLTSKSDRIDRVSAVSPTMPYTFLADIDHLTSQKYKSLLDFCLYQISKIYLDQDYGFVKDMNYGFKNAKDVKALIDAEKIFISASKVDKIKSRKIFNIILEASMLISSYSIKKETGLYSDGAVVNDPKYFEQLGVQYEMYDDNYHVYCDHEEYILKRAYKNLSKVKKISKK